MKILIAGASGMVGQALVQHLNNHEIIVIGRDKNKLKKIFPQQTIIQWEELKQLNTPVDVIIHLSGENISQKRWSHSFKQKLINSRTQTAQELVDWANQFKQPIQILATNAIGYYGCHSSRLFTEETLIDEHQSSCFLQEISFQWKNIWQSLNKIHHLKIMHFGVVLEKNQGMLKKLEPSFYLGLGAIIGSGKQFISWIHIEDLCQAIIFLMNSNVMDGRYNLTAPNSSTQADFSKILAQILHRPLWLHLPSIMIEILFGQMGKELLLEGQKVIPKRLLDQGFIFKYPDIKTALTNLYHSN